MRVCSVIILYISLLISKALGAVFLERGQHLGVGGRVGGLVEVPSDTCRDIDFCRASEGQVVGLVRGWSWLPVLPVSTLRTDP